MYMLYIYICICVYIYVYIHVHTYIYIYVHMYLFVFLCAQIYLRLNMPGMHTIICTHVCVDDVDDNVYVYMCIYIYMYMYISEGFPMGPRPGPLAAFRMVCSAGLYLPHFRSMMGSLGSWPVHFPIDCSQLAQPAV